MRRPELAISSCHVLGDLHKISWPPYLHAFASDRVFELQSISLQSDVDFAQLQAIARTRGRHLQLSARKVNHSRLFSALSMPPCRFKHLNNLRVPIAKLWFASRLRATAHKRPIREKIGTDPSFPNAIFLRCPPAVRFEA